ncbi:MAG TPA: DUF6370 family protein [Verrucomicrobiae bacterium]|nr:DUF6370 family protein [Verrucomicrobiae bacterium]
MKKQLAQFSLAGLVLFALAVPGFAKDKGKEVTVTGKGTCAKCALHETAKCQNAIQTTEDGKKVTYYLAKNEVSNDFHDNLCKGPKEVTAKGTVKEVKGKKILTASSIELAK